MPIIIASMSTLGTISATVAAKGCSALCSLASKCTLHADAFVLSSTSRPRGLDVLYSVMAAHPSNEDVQKRACHALWVIANHTSPAASSVMCVGRPGRVVIGAIQAAKRNHPADGECSVVYYANGALARLRQLGLTANESEVRECTLRSVSTIVDVVVPLWKSNVSDTITCVVSRLHGGSTGLQILYSRSNGHFYEILRRALLVSNVGLCG